MFAYTLEEMIGCFSGWLSLYTFALIAQHASQRKGCLDLKNKHSLENFFPLITCYLFLEE